MDKRLISSLAAAVLLALPALAQPLENSVIFTETVHSFILEEDVNVNIYLPQKNKIL